MAYSADPTLYLYTSLTAGSSHIITATSRLETILKANKIPFRAIDCATDEKARMLWGRRSRGRKLPGLVRFGSVVGDLDQIEEWNEFGELKDQIKATDELNTGAAPTSAPSHPSTVNTRGTLHPELPVTSSGPPSNPSSRASSQGRHISISEPTAKEKERETSPAPAEKSTSPSSEKSQNLIMRQLGAEAAARAIDRKTSGSKAAAVPTSQPAATSTAQTPTPASTKSQEITPPSEDPEMTAGKTPAQLASEGKTKSSTDKIGENASSELTGSPPKPGSDIGESNESDEKSTEEQILDLRRASTQTKQPSRLSMATPAEKSEDIDVEKPTEEERATDKLASTGPEVKDATVAPIATSTSDLLAEKHSSTSNTSTSSLPFKPVPEHRRSHRGSSLEEADKEAIRKAEEALRIKEENEDEDEDEDEDAVTSSFVRTERASGAGEGDELKRMDEKMEKITRKSTVGIGKDVPTDEVVPTEAEKEGLEQGVSKDKNDATDGDRPKIPKDDKEDEDDFTEEQKTELSESTKRNAEYVGQQTEQEQEQEQKQSKQAQEMEQGPETKQNQAPMQEQAPEPKPKHETDTEDADLEEAKAQEAQKDKENKKAQVALPSGKETDVEGKVVSLKPQETRAREPEDAGESVGD